MPPAATATGVATVLVAHQPAYLPWCGYFSRLLDVPQMITLDHVQFSERGYQHRNQILGRPALPQLLTLPIRRRFGQMLHEVRLADEPWARRHWRTLTQAYSKTPHWDRYAEPLADLYAQTWTHLVDLNVALTAFFLDALDLDVQLVRSSTLHPQGARTGMLINLCERTGSRILRVGTGALGYLDRRALDRAGIGVEVATYSHPPYPQHRRRAFTPGLSVLDLLVHQGPAARRVLTAGAATTTWHRP